MADEKFLNVLEMGKEAWNIWYNAQFRGLADLKGIRFTCADLAGINLTGALLQEADLRYTDFTGTDLRGADLTDAKLERVILCGAKLQEVKGLTLEQLRYAEGDKTTQLPTGFRPPAHWCAEN